MIIVYILGTTNLEEISHFILPKYNPNGLYCFTKNYLDWTLMSFFIRNRLKRKHTRNDRKPFSSDDKLQ